MGIREGVFMGDDAFMFQRLYQQVAPDFFLPNLFLGGGIFSTSTSGPSNRITSEQARPIFFFTSVFLWRPSQRRKC